MLIDIHMKFREDRLNGIQVIEQTRFCDRVRGKNIIKYKCKRWFFALCRSSYVDRYLYEVWFLYEDSLNGIQTDARGKKTICLPILKIGHIII